MSQKLGSDGKTQQSANFYKARYLTTAQFAALTPQDGDEVYLIVDATNGVVWHLRYNAGGGTYKWEYLGGPPLHSFVATQETSTTSTYAALTTPGPSITLPFGGDYDVQIGARMESSNSDNALISFDIGATGAVDGDAAESGTTAVAHSIASALSLPRKTGLTAVALVAKYKNSAANSGWWSKRVMRVFPVRIAQS